MITEDIDGFLERFANPRIKGDIQKKIFVYRPRESNDESVMNYANRMIGSVILKAYYEQIGTWQEVVKNRICFETNNGYFSFELHGTPPENILEVCGKTVTFSSQWSSVLVLRCM